MLTLLSCGQGQNISFDADYQAVLNYATTQGYTLPSAGQRIKQNQLVVSLKSAGVWSKLDTFANFATDGSSNFALIDWKRLSQSTAVNSPTFTANQGFLTNGTSSYINTNFSPRNNGVNFQKDSASFGYYLFTNINNSNSNVVGGGRDNLNNITYELSDTKVFLNSSTVITDLPVNNSTGFRHLNRNNSLNITRYVNGVGETANNVSDNTLISNFYLGASSLNNVASGFESNKFGVFFMGGDLSAEAANFNNAIKTYMLSL